MRWTYGATGFQDVPGSHWDFIAGTARYYETEDNLYVHANVCPNLPLKDQPDYNLFWEHHVVPSLDTFPGAG